MIYWRAHPHERPFSREDATSREWGTYDEPDAGYSCFADPSELFGYFNPGERNGDESIVVSFSGVVVGEGMDSEPLVMPDMAHVQWHKWHELHDIVGPAVVADIDRRNGWA